MATDLELRQSIYEKALRLPNSNLDGFVLYKGSPDSAHVVLGENHSVAAAICVTRALDNLVDEKQKTLVVAETPLGVRDYKITNVADAFVYRKELAGWQELSIDLLLKRGAHLMTHDSQRFVRVNISLKKNPEAFMKVTRKRDYTLAKTFVGKMCSGEYDRVIGVYGSTHVISPIFDAMLPGDTARYVFVGCTRDSQ